MAWENLQAELTEEFAQLEGKLPGKLSNSVTHTAALHPSEKVQRWKLANPEQWKLICARYRANNRESLSERARERQPRNTMLRKARKLQAKLDSGQISELTYRLELGLPVDGFEV